MPTTLAQLAGFLDEFDLTYDVNDDHEAIAIGFKLDPDETSYRDGDGDAHLMIVIRVMEGGEFVSMLAPAAWNVAKARHKAAVFEALLSLQARFKLLRFDYDPQDGEIRPNVELPVEDATLTSKQFHRLMHAVLIGVQRLDRVIRRALQTGRVCLELLDEEQARDEQAGGTGGGDRLEDLARQAGGIDALERLLGGEGLEEDGDEPGRNRKAG
jgi:hypothetical protein